MAKIIRLVVFNEDYWTKGLIYTQNILPLIKLLNTAKCKVEIISFTSIIKGVTCLQQIRSFKKELRAAGIKVTNFPVLYYPTRLLFSRWFLLPYLYLNTLFYIGYLRFKDKNKDVVYNLRSYPISLCFYKFYGNYQKLIFDPRTDWIEEAVNSGNFKSKGLSESIWRGYEGEIMNSFMKTIFISDVFLDNSIIRHTNLNSSKLVVLYNPIDYKKFKFPNAEHSDTVFLYTGSFGQWNRLENYLDFVLLVNSYDPNIRLVVCTSASRDYVEGVLNLHKYHSIREKIFVHYNVPIDDLPHYYAQCDYGLQLMHKKDSRVGVKFIEYIAAGITPIVNANVQGAAYLTRKYNIGIVITDSDTPASTYNKIINTPRLDTTSNSYKEIQRLSDLNALEEQLVRIYLK